MADSTDASRRGGRAGRRGRRGRRCRPMRVPGRQPVRTPRTRARSSAGASTLRGSMPVSSTMWGTTAASVARHAEVDLAPSRRADAIRQADRPVTAVARDNACMAHADRPRHRRSRSGRTPTTRPTCPAGCWPQLTRRGPARGLRDRHPRRGGRRRTPGRTSVPRWPRSAPRSSRRALAMLGVTEHHWLDHPDGGCADVDPEVPVGPAGARCSTTYARTRCVTFGPGRLHRATPTTRRSAPGPTSP